MDIPLIIFAITFITVGILAYRERKTSKPIMVNQKAIDKATKKMMRLIQSDIDRDIIKTLYPEPMPSKITQNIVISQDELNNDMVRHSHKQF